MSYDY